jgi:signal peptidase I
MTPTVSPGDHVLMEGLTFLARKPRRGDVAVFKTDGIARLPAATIYVKRIVGEPGDRLRISDGKLYINDKHVALSNAAGEIAYPLPVGAESMASQTDVTVPDGQYYVLGDNSSNSSDSRFWGCVPAKNIMGRIAFCYWPPRKAGVVR